MDAAELGERLQRGAAGYFDACHDRVDGFVQEHFRYPGAWRTNRPALGLDLLRSPCNLFWAPIYLFGQLLAWLCARLGLAAPAGVLRRLPSGLPTRVQTGTAERVCSELLMQEHPTLSLEAALLASLDELIDPDGERPDSAAALRPLVTEALDRYNQTRTASADIANSLFSAAVGAFAFKKFTPGGLAVGILLAGWWAQHSAVMSFPLGSWLGNLYYGLFPAEPSAGLTVGGIVLALVMLSVLASFSGLLLDPLQSLLGLHQRRLHRLVDHLQRDFLRSENSSFNPRDPWLARVLDLVDAARSQLG